MFYFKRNENGIYVLVEMIFLNLERIFGQGYLEIEQFKMMRK